MVNSSWQNLIGSSFKNLSNKRDNSDNSNIDGSDSENDELIINSEWQQCKILQNRITNITTVDEYSKFDFQVRIFVL